MTRNQIILAALAPGKQHRYSPVQVQKLFFLVDRNVGNLIGGPFFDFKPYDYGPFDQSVYSALEQLAFEGEIEVTYQGRWRTYALTAHGQHQGLAFLGTLPQKVQKYVDEASGFVRNHSFSQIVSAIYKAYPEMREKSIFRG